MMGKEMLIVKNLSTGYKTKSNEEVNAVNNVSLSIEDGKSLGIAGESGCGKSTLAMSIMGYYFPPLEYKSGEIIIDGKDITKLDVKSVRKNILGTEIAYIPQAAMNTLNPTCRIIKFIEDIYKSHGYKLSKKEIRDIARERFIRLNLPEKILDQYPVELSGGMKQRTVIAISTMLNPKVLIADEPSSALDVSSQKIVISLLHDLMEKQLVRSMLFITHELPLLYNAVDDIMVMYAGQIVEEGTAENVVKNPIHPYSKGLMESIIVPEKGTRDNKLKFIPGTPPNLKNPHKGCMFAPRCFYANQECLEKSISMIETGDERKYRCRHSISLLREMYKNE